MVSGSKEEHERQKKQTGFYSIDLDAYGVRPIDDLTASVEHDAKGLRQWVDERTARGYYVVSPAGSDMVIATSEPGNRPIIALPNRAR
jgi:hypothetical protein